MTRFIFLVFGFLALAFYEFSGGANFSPSATRMAAVEGRQQDGASDFSEDIADTEIVARADLNLVSFAEINGASQPLVARNDPPLQFAPLVQTASLEEATSLPELSSGTQSIAALEGVQPSARAATPSVAPAANNIRFEGNTSRATSERVAAALQTRLVNGDLVNLRSGPGTAYGIVSQLSRGDEVEVLNDNGAGWVKLRPIGGGPDGWMADFLLSR